MSHVLGLKLHLADLEAGVRTGERGNIEAVRPDGDDFVVVEVNGLAGVRDDRGNVAREKVFALSDPEHERTAATRTDKNTGDVRMDDGDSVGADDLSQRFAHRLDERCLVFSFRLSKAIPMR